MNQRRFSHSQIASYMACPHKYMLEKVKGYVPRRKSAPLAAGSAFHKFKESWALGLPLEQCKKAMREAGKVDHSVLTAEEIRKHEIEQARMEAIADVYAEVYAGDMLFTMIAEKEFELEVVPNRISYSGKIDCLLKDGEGKWWVVETKTAATGTLSSTGYFDRIPIDNQSLGYMAGATKILGDKPEGVIYDVVVKTQHRQGKNETLRDFCSRLESEYRDRMKWPERFIRKKFPIGMSRMEHWLKDMIAVSTELANKLDRQEEVWPRRSAECNSVYGPCPYLEACLAGKADERLYEHTKSQAVAV